MLENGGFLTSLFFGFVPMFLFAFIVYWLDRYEKEPKMLLVGVFTWGAVIAAGTAFILNTILGMGVFMVTESETAALVATGSLFAPVVEESLKGFAVLGVFLIFRREFDSLMDGIVYASVAALGFAATENTYYIYTYGFLEGGWEGLVDLVLVRVVLVGWQHPFYTAFIGIGLAISRLNRGIVVSLTAPVIGWGLAVFTHSLHNTLVTFLSGAWGAVIVTIFDWGGWFLMFLFILSIIRREQHIMKVHLKEEVELGVMSQAHYETACSAWAQNKLWWASLFSRAQRTTRRFYRLAATLAHKKRQRKRLGEEDVKSDLIEELRTQLAELAPMANTC
jgi:protease PrsW